MIDNVNYSTMRPMLGYIKSQQLHHYYDLMTLGVSALIIVLA